MSPFQGLQFFTNCPSSGSPMGAVFQEQSASLWVPHRVRSPASKICSCLGFSSHAFPGPVQSLLQCGLPMESQLSQDSSGRNRLFWSVIDECSNINCLTLFIFLTKKVKMTNSAPHEAQKSSKNVRKSMLKVSSPSEVQVDCQ